MVLHRNINLNTYTQGAAFAMVNVGNYTFFKHLYH